MLGRYLMKAAQLGKAGCTKDWLTQESGVEATHALSAALLKAELLRRQSYSTGLTLPAPKELSSILKIETVQDASKDEIAHLWNEYHFKLGRGHVSTVLDAAAFKTFRERVGECPLFVLPLKKPAGFVTMFLQAQLPRVLFTGLEDYKVRGSQATPYLVVTHYDDLAESKDIVLVRGDIILPAHLQDAEAADLLEASHEFYLRRDLFDHVQAFNRNSANFDFNEVLRTRGISPP